MKKNRVEFCAECRDFCHYELKKVVEKYSIRDKEYDLELTYAFCKNCGNKINIPGIMDARVKEMDEQYRKKEGIVTNKDIENLMNIYNIGKAPLSLALGFGEITITRYLQGQIPSKEYSIIVQKSLESPEFMIDMLKTNKKRIGAVAYNKAMESAKELKKMFDISKKMLVTLSYIFENMQEVTPLALQKILYYVQGIYMVYYNVPLFKEDCQAWIHGPVYEEVYKLFRTFKYNPIDDERFAVIKNRFRELSNKEKEVIDLVIDTFGMYSGKVLEKITHLEEPWENARKGYLSTEVSNVFISKEEIKKYFEKVHKKYDITTKEGVRNYIVDKLEKAEV